jgi:acyl dehydratase
MTIRNIVGKEYPPFTLEVEKRWIRSFVQAVGDDNPIYFDEQAARAAGFRAIPAPPTFPFTLIMEANQSFMVLDELGVDKTKAMHVEQSFEYFAELCAGDVITGRQKVVEQFDKKGGAMHFIVTEFRLENQRAEHVCNLRTTVVVRAV